jgi:ABC-2 type transport system ATP-binding protein
MPLRVQQLSKQYGAQHAVRDLSFEVPAGQVLGFLGPNGAGKSTTMKILTGYLRPSSGDAWFDGYSVCEHSLELRRRVGYLPEHNPLYLDLYVREYLDFAARAQGLRGPRVSQRISEVIELTGLGPEQHKRIGALSKGYRQRVGLSQALLHEPGLLILDEPTSGLDPNQVLDIRSLIREAGRDKTVIFSSHILSEVEAVAERILILSQGQLVADAPTDEIRSLARGEQVIRLETDRPGLNPEPFRAIAGLRAVEARGETEWEMRCDADSDPRKAIFEACLAQGFAILGLSRQNVSLEDAFRALTQGSAQAGA